MCVEIIIKICLIYKLLNSPLYVYVYTKIIITVSEIVGLASQLATQNCLGCSKLNLGSTLLAEVATHLSHIKLRLLYILNIIL